uniref:Uncharacterized protein n=1 Tax=Nelumbo nucifera TaxID=4432 RepID=A0A822YL72_NELNU|nr:TPA_asm: hypothetical protein HUJ06_011182 [Nelumbo nucifera]
MNRLEERPNRLEKRQEKTLTLLDQIWERVNYLFPLEEHSRQVSPLGRALKVAEDSSLAPNPETLVGETVAEVQNGGVKTIIPPVEIHQTPNPNPSIMLSNNSGMFIRSFCDKPHLHPFSLSLSLNLSLSITPSIKQTMTFLVNQSQVTNVMNNSLPLFSPSCFPTIARTIALSCFPRPMD